MPGKIGEDALKESFVNMVDYLRDVNEGKMAMDAPPIEPAPAQEEPSYESRLAQAASRGSQEQDLAMER